MAALSSVLLTNPSPNLALQLSSNGDCKEAEMRARMPLEPRAILSVSWPILMYASIQGFYMYNANIFGLNVIKDFVGM
ncbi:hypothetical protein HHK36_026010 [Tetracentron sinense]|uniref:Uncharacterized protein n=1 Tax=Tetracentron sinense TaxID=13715 RepID=A0A834YPD0_TETSI|nr:hypothetical protein HHK36_026010 [Tetracentron sinense]